MKRIKILLVFIIAAVVITPAQKKPFSIEALYKVADGVNNFSGKSQTKNSEKTNSGVSLSSTELADEQSTKPSEN